MADERKPTLVELIEDYDAAIEAMDDEHRMIRAAAALSRRIIDLGDVRPTHRGWEYRTTYMTLNAIRRVRVPRPAAEIDAEHP